MTNYNHHISSVKDGSIVYFPNSNYPYMKVCDRDGIGGVVKFYSGLYISIRDLEHYKLGLNVDVMADNFDEFVDNIDDFC